RPDIRRACAAGHRLCRRSRTPRAGTPRRSGGQPLAAAIATGGNDDTATLGCHARAEAMTALTHELGRLIGTLHFFKYRGVRPFLGLSLSSRSVVERFGRRTIEIAPEWRSERER